MDLKQLRFDQEIIDARTLGLLSYLVSSFRALEMSEKDWVSFLNQALPVVAQARRDSSRLARAYYDASRARKYPGERFDINLSRTSLQGLHKRLKEPRQRFLPKDTSPGAARAVLDGFQREIRNANRYTILSAVLDDPKALGWVRLGKDESCDDCLLAIARGPIYKDALRKGSRSYKAIAFLSRGFHPGCDCDLVPVFAGETWDTRS